jgi:hypothetical protein
VNNHPEHREAVGALTRLLRDSGTANPDAVALEVIAILTSRGWRQRIEPPPPRAEPVPATEAWKAIRAEAGK